MPGADGTLYRLAARDGGTNPAEERTGLDADYRGEICIILVNLSSEPFEIRDGERIAQMVVASYEQAGWKPVESLDETERGAGGFGHSGEK